jgi:hypothetical protein
MLTDLIDRLLSDITDRRLTDLTEIIHRLHSDKNKLIDRINRLPNRYSLQQKLHVIMSRVEFGMCRSLSIKTI